MEKIPWEEIKILYETDRYDGIIAGIIEYQKKVYYLDCWDFNYGGWEVPSNIEIYNLRHVIKNPKLYPYVTIQKCGAINIKKGETLYIYYKNSKFNPWSVCRPRKFYIYELSTLSKWKDYFQHFMFILLVKNRLLGPFGFNLYYIKTEGKGLNYYKNKIIGWTEQ